ncbi:MAG: hypothetical protein IPI06_16010 [Gammaproteobacteria bacterium]|nr:hypothetical protein [Gammaproteobacteria bacterium]
MSASRRAPATSLVAFASGIACLVYTIDSSIANVSRRTSRAICRPASDRIGWVLTAYVISSAIMLPLAGFLAHASDSGR